MSEKVKMNIAEAMNMFFNRPRKVEIAIGENKIEFFVKPASPDVHKKYSELLEANKEDQDIAIRYLMTELVCDEDGAKVFATPEDIKLTVEFKKEVINEIFDKGFGFRMSDITIKNLVGSPSSEAVSQ